MRSKPTDGTQRKLMRIMSGKYAMSVMDVARNLRISERHAWRFLAALEERGVIYLRYRYRRNYYSLTRKNHEAGQTDRSPAFDAGEV